MNENKAEKLKDLLLKRSAKLLVGLTSGGSSHQLDAKSLVYTSCNLDPDFRSKSKGVWHNGLLARTGATTEMLVDVVVYLMVNPAKRVIITTYSNTHARRIEREVERMYHKTTNQVLPQKVVISMTSKEWVRYGEMRYGEAVKVFHDP